MLKIVIKSKEHYDEDRNMFFMFPAKDTTLTLEHSLLSISKWEEKWHKPFLNDTQLTEEETLDYIRCMCINPSSDSIDTMLLLNLSNENVMEINNYISNPMTATFFNDKEIKKKIGKRIVTNELIYYWMTAYQIPFTCEKWHISKLLTLIKVCNAENEAQNEQAKNGHKTPRMNKNQIASRKALNAQRRAALHSRG